MGAVAGEQETRLLGKDEEGGQAEMQESKRIPNRTASAKGLRQRWDWAHDEWPEG